MAKPQYNGPWQRIRIQVLERDNYECRMRGVHCLLRATEVNHKIPVALGGAWWDMGNLEAACYVCNRSNSKPKYAPSRNW